MMQTAIREQIPKRINPDIRQTGRAEKLKNYSANNSKMTAKNQQFSFAELHILMRGNWRGCHSSAGVLLRKIGKQCDCQGCGGTDRFSLQSDYEETGRWFCRQGGDPTGGDGFSLFGHIFGWSPAEQLRYVTDYLGLSKMDNSERDKIRVIAEKHQKELQAAIAKKDEQARRDSNLLIMLENQIDEIRFRQHLQREIERVNRVFIAEYTIDEIKTAQELNEAILETYAHKEGVNYV